MFPQVKQHQIASARFDGYELPHLEHRPATERAQRSGWGANEFETRLWLGRGLLEALRPRNQTRPTNWVDFSPSVRHPRLW